MYHKDHDGQVVTSRSDAHRARSGVRADLLRPGPAPGWAWPGRRKTSSTCMTGTASSLPPAPAISTCPRPPEADRPHPGRGGPPRSRAQGRAPAAPGRRAGQAARRAARLRLHPRPVSHHRTRSRGHPRDGPPRLSRGVGQGPGRRAERPRHPHRLGPAVVAAAVAAGAGIGPDLRAAGVQADRQLRARAPAAAGPAHHHRRVAGDHQPGRLRPAARAAGRPQPRDPGHPVLPVPAVGGVPVRAERRADARPRPW
jgi:hypothetical protein